MTPKLPAPDAASINWNRLSDEAAETLALVAVPAALGLSHAEISEQTGWSGFRIARRLTELRAEIRAAAAEH